MNKSAVVIGTTFVIIAFSPQAFGGQAGDVKTEQAKKELKGNDVHQSNADHGDKWGTWKDGKGGEGKCGEGKCAANRGAMRDRCARPDPPDWCKDPVKSDRTDGKEG